MNKWKRKREQNRNQQQQFNWSCKPIYSYAAYTNIATNTNECGYVRQNVKSIGKILHMKIEFDRLGCVYTNIEQFQFYYLNWNLIDLSKNKNPLFRKKGDPMNRKASIAVLHLIFEITLPAMHARSQQSKQIKASTPFLWCSNFDHP